MKVIASVEKYENAVILTRDFKISKSERDTARAYCRYLTSLCLRLYIRVRLRAASGPSIAYCVTRAPLGPKQGGPVWSGPFWTTIFFTAVHMPAV